ncbi:NuA4 histone H4 acetyltransferase complex and the SWR1 complex subunit [Malassezia sp. CBS 17886]|nr:NuA4 histone H4 acetyltransferase complex and the SWR1 complex subunit [Malassezia sp. CBS 17886]
MAGKRMRGIAVSRPVLIGSTATPLTPAEKLSAPPDHTHRWTVAVRSAASAPLAAAADRGAGADAGADAAGVAGMRLRDHELDLHRAVGDKDDLSYFIKRVQFRLHETYTQPTRNIDRPPFGVTETGWGEFEIQIKIFFVPEAGEKPLTLLHHLKLHPWGGAATAAGVDGAAPTSPALPPVIHSWQYDEIVFPEPLEPFYDILMAHPPTPWPAKSAQAFVDPAVYEAQRAAARAAASGNTSAQLPHPLHTPTGHIFEALSLEAQRDEADRIDLARADAVRQLDEDRDKLIRMEKTLGEQRARLASLEQRAGAECGKQHTVG